MTQPRSFAGSSVPSPVATTDAAPSDALLVRRAAAGDVVAFEALYRTNAGRVFALCRRLCGDSSQAEELTQEAFVRAWQKLATFRGEAAFATWLHRLTVNVVLGHRRARLRRELEVEPDAFLTPLGAAPAVEPALDLEQAISGLPERARTVFVLHDVEGYRHEEIANLAGMAVGTSRAQLHRARRLLREALA